MAMHTLMCLLLLASSASALFAEFGRKQSAGVRGKLTCHGEAAADVLVKLYDDDTGLDGDDLMATTKTDGRGFFEMEGFAFELTTIGKSYPKINIYTDCNDGIKPCQRKLSIFLPKSYVSNGDHPSRYYEMPSLELAGKFGEESRDCIH